MNYLESDFKELERNNPPFYTELLGNLQATEEFRNIGIASSTWDQSLTYLYEYKQEIIDRFNEYYALYEIGQETPQRFQTMCNRLFNARKKKWNYRIQLYTANVTTQIGRINQTIKASEILREITGNDTESRTGSDTVTGEHGNVQSYETSKETKNYDTPVTQVSSLNDGYLSGGSGEDNTTDVTGTNTINDTTEIERNVEFSTEKNDNTNEDTTVTYKFQDKPIMELIEEQINVWNDVVQSIIEDCKELFINVTARI